MTTEKQRKEKVQYDTRTFPEIYESLSKLQQCELRDEIIKRTGAARATLWFWRTGKKIPARPSDRKAVVGSLKKVLGITAQEYLLFDFKK